MSILMKPLPQSRLEIISGMLAHSIEEANLTGRASVPDMLAKLRRGYENQCMGVYVDDFDKPQHLLIMAHMPGLATEALCAFVIRIYSAPEARGDTKAVDVMVATAENYARLHQAECLIGGSWIFRGARDIEALWKYYGFEPQEKSYVKFLT